MVSYSHIQTEFNPLTASFMFYLTAFADLTVWVTNFKHYTDYYHLLSSGECVRVCFLTRSSGDFFWK